MVVVEHQGLVVEHPGLVVVVMMTKGDCDGNDGVI